MSFRAIKINDNYWEIQTVCTTCTGIPDPEDEHIWATLCYMKLSDIIKLFNEMVPGKIEETYMKGNPDCVHAWRPWKFNDSFMICSKCPAMRKIKKLVPKEYK
jgi:hypothetical protein